MKRIASIAVIALWLSSSAFAASANGFSPSFNCAKASTNVEKLICSSPKLSALDVKLSQVYKQSLKASTDKASLKKEQSDWVKNQRDPCSNATCLEKSYQDRIEDLESMNSYRSKPAAYR